MLPFDVVSCIRRALSHGNGTQSAAANADADGHTTDAAAALRERLSSAAGAIEHPPLKALLASVVGPLVETVVSGAMAAAAAEAEGGVGGTGGDVFKTVEAAARATAVSQRDRGLRGKAWALLGLLR
jgi:hypothetical protein